MLEQNLDELNIFALRDLARRTGVKSPTSKKKEQLISEIVEIVSGRKAPHVLKSKQGRPPKTFGYDFTNVFSNQLLGGTESSLSKQTLNQESIECQNEDVVTLAGWLEMVNNNAALLWVEKNFKNETYFVPSEVLKNIPVKMGDRAVVEISSEENTKVVKKIFSVNDCPVAQMKVERKNYQDFEHDIPTKKLKFKDKEFNKLNLMIGENVYVYGNNNNDNTKKIINILNSCEIENKIYINVSIVEKNKIFLKSLNYTENFISNLTDGSDVSKKILFLAIERAKRILEVEEDVLIVIDDLMSVLGVDETLAKALMSLTKNSNNGSITIMSVMPNFGINQFEKLADVRLKISDSEIEKI